MWTTNYNIFPFEMQWRWVKKVHFSDVWWSIFMVRYLGKICCTRHDWAICSTSVTFIKMYFSLRGLSEQNDANTEPQNVKTQNKNMLYQSVEMNFYDKTFLLKLNIYVFFLFINCSYEHFNVIPVDVISENPADHCNCLSDKFPMRLSLMYLWLWVMGDVVIKY